MAQKMLDGVTAVGVSRHLKVGEANSRHTIMASFEDYGTTGVSALVIKMQGAMVNGHKTTGIITNPGLVIGSTVENIANAAFVYQIQGTSYSKGAVAAGTALVAGNAITTATYGVILAYIDTAGTITYKYPATTQAYASAALAMVAGDTLVTSMEGTNPGLCYLGRVLVYNNTGSEWNSLTDSLSDDVTNAVFMDAMSNWIDIVTYTLDATDLANQKAAFEVADKRWKWVRHYLSTLTGSGRVHSWHTGGK